MTGAKKSLSFTVSIWHDEKTGHIKISSNEEGFITTVTDDSESIRYHQNLYKKLKAVLVRHRKWTSKR